MKTKISKNKKPVLFIFFRKEDTTKLVFNEIKKYQPEKLYISSDGGRNPEEQAIIDELRNWIDSQIDWDCDVVRLYSDVNKGCKDNVSSSISYVFEHEESAIILEDDTLPLKGFFEFVSQMLDMYKNDDKVMMITGSNFLPHRYYKCAGDYTFTRDTQIWGWGTWKRVWNKYNVEISDLEDRIADKSLRNTFENLYDYRKKVNEYRNVANGNNNTWDYQFDYMFRCNEGLCIVPRDNHIKNIGFGTEISTHTPDVPKFYAQVLLQGNGTTVTEIQKLPYITCDHEYDLRLAQARLNNDIRGSIISRRIHKLLGWKFYMWLDGKMRF